VSIPSLKGNVGHHHQMTAVSFIYKEWEWSVVWVCHIYCFPNYSKWCWEETDSNVVVFVYTVDFIAVNS